LASLAKKPLTALSQVSSGPLSQEESLYAGAAIVFGIQQLTSVNGHPELLSQSQLLAAANTSAQNIQYGLTHLEPADAIGIRVPDYAASSADHGRVQIRNIGVFAKG
jgi:hypothetical protein